MSERESLRKDNGLGIRMGPFRYFPLVLERKKGSAPMDMFLDPFPVMTT